MPCLYSEGMESGSADESTPGSTPRCSREQPFSNPVEDELIVVTSAGWFFAPLWSPRANTRCFGNGVKHIEVEAWLDDRTDLTRSNNSRRASMESGSSVKRDSKGRLTTSSESSSSLSSPGHGRDSIPPQCPYLCIPSADKPQSLTPCDHDWSKNAFTQERVGKYRRSPQRSPAVSPQPRHSPNCSAAVSPNRCSPRSPAVSPNRCSPRSPAVSPNRCSRSSRRSPAVSPNHCSHCSPRSPAVSSNRCSRSSRRSPAVSPNRCSPRSPAVSPNRCSRSSRHSPAVSPNRCSRSSRRSPAVSPNRCSLRSLAVSPNRCSHCSPRSPAVSPSRRSHCSACSPAVSPNRCSHSYPRSPAVSPNRCSHSSNCSIAVSPNRRPPPPRRCSPPAAPSPCCGCSPRPPRRSGLCGRGEGCDWMTGYLSGGPRRMGSVAELCQGALTHVAGAVLARHCALSLARRDTDEGGRLEVVVALTTVGEDASPGSHAHMKLVKDVMGYVVATGVPLNVSDVYKDPRFPINEEQKSGNKLTSVLSVPIKNDQEEVVGAAVVIAKKLNGGPGSSFTHLDEKVFSAHMDMLGMVLDNAQLYESSRQEAKRSQVLLDLAQVVSEEQWTLEEQLSKMAATILPFTHAQYCTVFIADELIKDSFSQVIHMELEDSDPTFKVTKRECDITEVDVTYALRTLIAMEMLNVSENSQDPTRSLICCPVRKSNNVIAVCQLRNKYSEEMEAFNRYDERLLEDLALYCSLALQNAQTFHITEKRKASLVVTEEVLSYHITAAEEEIRALQEASIPSAESLQIMDFKFSDFGLSEEATTQAAVRMFLDLNLVQEFNIDYNSLCQWVLSVRRGYRNVPYHNWSHGLSTAQCMFAMLMTTGQLQEKFSRLEVLALMIATLNHDLDHRGVSNSYIERSQHPIAHLYGHSSLEHHHYALCLFILNNPGSQILSGLSEEDHRIVLPMIERAILATDLAVYIERRSEFFDVARKGEVSWSNERHRDLLRSMLMTASDISAITKPWSVQRRTAKLVATEFFAQGDRERQEFNIKPIDVMNRDNITRLPHMQVEYIDGICDPLYDALSGLFDSCSPLREGCRKNRDNWQHLAEGEEEPEDDE